MRKFLSVLAIALFTVVSAQTYTVSAGVSFPFIGSKQTLDGAVSYDIKPGFNVGLSTAFLMGDGNEIELGAYYQSNKISYDFVYDFELHSGIPAEKREKNLNLIYIPLNYKYNFGDQFFIKGGPLFTIDTDEKDSYFDNFSGLGFGISAGKDFGDEGLKIRVAPYANAHSLWSFNDNHRYINDFGLQLGLAF